MTVNLGGKKKPPSCGLTPQHRPYSFTSFQFQRRRANAWAVVGQGYILKKKTNGDTLTFDYNKGSSHSQTSSLGIGISGKGVDVGYNGSGSTNSTADRTEDYAPAHGNAWFRTLFKTGQFRAYVMALPTT